MAKIEELRKVDLSKIPNEKLAAQIKGILEIYDQAESKTEARKETQDNVNALYGLVKKFAPEAIPVEKKSTSKPDSGNKSGGKGEESKSEPKTTKTKPKSSNTKLDEMSTDSEELSEQYDVFIKGLEELMEFADDIEDEDKLDTIHLLFIEAVDVEEKELRASLIQTIKEVKENFIFLRNKKIGSKLETLIDKFEKQLSGKSKKVEPKKEDNDELLAQLKALEPKLENCRRVIREHNAQKREAEGPKPKPTRHTQLKNKLLSIASLIPDKFKNDSEVLEKTEDLLLEAHSGLIEAWGMDKVKAKSGASAIQERFDEIEEKEEKKGRKKLAKRWKNQMPDIDSLMRKEWKDSEGLENEARDMLDDFKEAIKLFEQDANKAKEFLTKRYSKEQLERHLPDFIKEQLAIK